MFFAFSEDKQLNRIVPPFEYRPHGSGNLAGKIAARGFAGSRIDDVENDRIAFDKMNFERFIRRQRRRHVNISLR